MSASPSISVIIPCRNERRYIARMLDSVLAQDAGSHVCEVLIADGLSADGTREILEEYSARDSRIQVIDNPGLIVPTGLNRAVRSASGDIIVRMDAHTEYALDYIRNCVEVLMSSGADNVGGAPRVRINSFRGKVFGAAYHSRFAVGGARSHDYDFEGDVDSVFYGCWWRSTLLKIGLFDEALVRNQDDELNLRISRSGGRIFQSPKIVCWYTPRLTCRALFRQYCQYGFWKIPVIRKHRIPASIRHLVPALFVGAQILSIVVAAVALAAGSGSVAAAAGASLLLLLTVYFVACWAAAVVQAQGYGVAVAACLPPLFAVYHYSYGIGFLTGLLYWVGKKESAGGSPKLFVDLTR